jgi:fumarate hydratase class I/fumarate hydratase subunit alpha
MLADNARIAARDRVPICQDTGTVWVRVSVGADEGLIGNVQAECDAAVAEAYASAGLRMSTVADAAYDRANRGDNTPAWIDIDVRPGSGATVDVLLKGAGSDNASRVVMLPPAEGLAGVRRVVLETATEKAASACPPLVIGVGVGATFDKVASLAKKSLLRRIGHAAGPAADSAFEAELLAAVNATGIGPAGLGGDTTALAVHVETAPCHIAALPVAVNVGCSAMRSITVEIEALP